MIIPRAVVDSFVLTALLQVRLITSASAIDWDEPAAENSMSSCTGEGRGGMGERGDKEGRMGGRGDGGERSV